MKHRFLTGMILLTLLPLWVFGATDFTAADMLQKVSDRLCREKSFTCDFSLVSQGNPVKGSLLLSNDRFHITTGEFETWYDGVTQWTLSKADKEVAVIEPTPEELQQVNPLAILSSFRNAYNISYAGVSTTGTKTLILKAKSPRAQIATAQITVNTKTLDPISIELLFSNRQKATIHISSFKSGGEVPAKLFRFDKSNFPGVSVNDMR